ncbi:MAG TPA: cyclic nucleotide-binding domain-containing protein [Anaerolineae bacterium]|nr:cyclic nucleotide-binding domain-containing protein [Anaerolineae bacterium]HQI83301.1 cyclic nucleotide-binding domain-containing protein [Anaerolineae bacterium]
MHLQESKRVLRQSDLFRDLNEIHLDLVLMVCEEISYRGGEYIFHQNDPGDALYIVARGEVDILMEPQNSNNAPMIVATSKPNDTFGEILLVDQGTRSASARCKTDTQLLRISRDRLLKLCYDYPEIGFHIMHRIAAELALKLRSSNQDIREQLFHQS